LGGALNCGSNIFPSGQTYEGSAEEIMGLSLLDPYCMWIVEVNVDATWGVQLLLLFIIKKNVLLFSETRLYDEAVVFKVKDEIVYEEE
jgi:hypothetical protein